MESGEEIYECVRCGSRDFEIAMRAAEGLGVLVCKQCLLVVTERLWLGEHELILW